MVTLATQEACSRFLQTSAAKELGLKGIIIEGEVVEWGVGVRLFFIPSAKSVPFVPQASSSLGVSISSKNTVIVDFQRNLSRLAIPR